MSIKKKIFAGTAGLVGLALTAGIAFAVFGSKLADFQPTPSGNGRAVAFDGSTLYYTLYPDAGNIYTTSPANVAGPTLVTAPALQWGALAWDSVNSQLWGARYGDFVADFYTIDEVTGLATFQFNFAFPAGESCYAGNVNNPDGLAYDATDNTLWISDDAATKVYHVDASGVVLSSFTVPNSKCNTGLAVNGKYLWMAVQSGADLGPHDIYRVDKTNPTVVLSTIPWGVVNNPGPEDLELDLVTYAPEHCALWSNQFGANNRLVAWELEGDLKDECTDTRRMTGGGSVFTKNPGRVTHGFELHCDAAKLPNRLEVNWDKGNKFHLENLTSAVCVNDPALDEEQPVAGFDTYKGKGTGRYNGVSGATAEWKFTDDGEPGTTDAVELQIKDVNNAIVLTVSGVLDRGNQQAHAQ